MALCVLVKTKEPKIEWRVSQRNPEDLVDYLAKAGHVAREIAAGASSSARACSAHGDFLPVCLRDEQRIVETLVRVH